MQAPSWSDVWDYYSAAKVALTRLTAQDLNGSLPPASSLRFMTLLDAVAELRLELEAEVSLALVASVEAALRTDLQRRVDGRLKDPASRKLRELWRAANERVRLEDLLDEWKDIVGKKAVFGDFKALLHRRHWVAHGRYWTDKSGVKPDAEEARLRCEALITALPR